MSKVFKLSRFVAVGFAAMALALGGCSDSDSKAPAPPVDEEPVIVDPTPTVPQNEPTARTLWQLVPTITVEAAAVADGVDDDFDGDTVVDDAGTVFVNFTVKDENGASVADLPAADFNFIVAQLVPTGSTFNWQSYINRLEVDKTVGAATDGGAVYAKAIQATTESASDGVLTYDSIDGSYTYKFVVNLETGPFFPEDPDTSAPIDPATLEYTFLGDAALTYDATRTHRVAIQLRRVTTDDARAPGNAFYDFIPATGAEIVPATDPSRLIAETASCNSCHDGQLALHGGNRTEVGYCVTCHNPGTVDANSGFNLDMANMVHKIHRGANLPSVEAGDEYAIWGHNESKHDYSEVHYPSLYYGLGGEPLNCSNCHTETATTPDGDNWFNYASQLACFSCHDEHVEDKKFAYHDGGTYTYHVTTCTYPFPNQVDITSAASCGGCHWGNTTPNLRRTAVVHNHDFARPQFEYVIDEVTVNAENKPVVTFGINWRENELGTWAAMDLDATDLPSITPIGATDPVALSGGPSIALVYSTAGADWDMNTPMGQPETVSLASLRDGSGGALVDNGDGTFTATLGKTYPAEATRRAVFMQGYFTLASKRLDTPSPLEHVDVDSPRRQIVEQDKCLGCHGGIGFHGGNRVDNPMVCAGCHNTRLTSSGHTLPDGLPEDEVSNNFKDMIHGVHGGTLVGVRNFNGNATAYDFTTIHYPGVLSNCEACHAPGTYEEPVFNAAVTSNVVLDRTSAEPGDDDRVTSPFAASCVGCHNSTATIDHMEASGGFVREKRSEILSTENGCVHCHGEGATIAPVSEVHTGLL